MVGNRHNSRPTRHGHLPRALRYLGEITGTITSVDLLCQLIIIVIISDVVMLVTPVRDGTMVEIYLNHKLVSKITDSTKPAEMCGSHNNVNILLCTRENKVRLFTGKIDDVRFWNRALTVQEIELLYKFGHELSSDIKEALLL